MRDSLPQNIKLEEKEYVLDYENELRCSEETINGDLMNHASIFAWYCILSEMAADELANKRLELEVLEARLDFDYRKSQMKTGEKPTDKKTQVLVSMDEKYQTAVVVKNQAQRCLGILKGIKDAFGHRMFMLQALAANLRSQSSPDVMLKKQEMKEKV